MSFLDKLLLISSILYLLGVFVSLHSLETVECHNFTCSKDTQYCNNITKRCHNCSFLCDNEQFQHKGCKMLCKGYLDYKKKNMSETVGGGKSQSTEKPDYSNRTVSVAKEEDTTTIVLLCLLITIVVLVGGVGLFYICIWKPGRCRFRCRFRCPTAKEPDSPEETPLNDTPSDSSQQRPNNPVNQDASFTAGSHHSLDSERDSDCSEVRETAASSFTDYVTAPTNTHPEEENYDEQGSDLGSQSVDSTFNISIQPAEISPQKRYDYATEGAHNGDSGIHSLNH